MGRSSIDSMSYFLFARPSFVAGFAQVVDIGGALVVFNESVTGEQADYFALKSDWMAVGADLNAAVDELVEPSLAAHPQRVAVG